MRPDHLWPHGKDTTIMESFIPRIGGKRLLRKQILARFPADKFTRYIEPFGGAGWVLFSRERHAPEEIFNDIDGELINLFRCVKNHCGELQRQMQWMLNSREVFEDALALKSVRGLTDIQRAALYFIVTKESYGANGRDYGASARNLERVTAYLAKISHRLQSVKIEHRNYADILKIYDKTDALSYLDPPYHGAEKYYGSPFPEQDHIQLCDMLKALKGRFILSYNDDDFIRQLYRDFKIEAISRSSNLTMRYTDKEKQYHELLIKNF